jgi:hypothetical protein
VPVFPSGLLSEEDGTELAFPGPCVFSRHGSCAIRSRIHSHTGPFIFEFQRSRIEAKEFLPKLDRFLGGLPTRYDYAVEVRTLTLLGPRYSDILKANGVAHVYNMGCRRLQNNTRR